MPEEMTEEELKNMSPEEIAEMQKQNCLFCHIASGKVPAKKVYEDQHCFAILDINPATKGHMLLMPKEHFVVLPQLSEPLLAHMSKVSKILSRAALKVLGSEGTNVFVANGVVAGQRAPHLIIHVIPRKEGDGINCFDLPEKGVSPQDMIALQQVLAQKLGMRPAMPVQQKEQPQQNKGLEEIDLNQLKKMLQ
jgi:histidine triad (HIT) family protein